MNKTSLFIVLVEDTHQGMLVRRCLKGLGVGSHQMRIEPSPSGAGSAENWVRKRFAEEAVVYRSRKARTALIVVVDADSYTVQVRLGQLDQALKDRGKPVVAEGERIARLVPKRNVETWILCLNETEVDEEKDYKRTQDNWNQLIPPAARTLSEWTRSGAEPPNVCIDSLRRGVRELKRLEF